MKTTFKPIPTIFATFAALAILIASNAVAATQIANEFWVSTNTNTANLGTLNDPFDGSTQAKFDSVMNSLPANSTIHILAGLYQTKGLYGGFSVKTGQKILGSGMDVTTLQFPAGFFVGGSGAFMFGNNNPATNVGICDLTCDCNILNNSDTYSGIGLAGTQNAVRRVKVINCAKFGGNSEAWGISLSDFPPNVTPTMNNIIEDCEVSHFHYGTNGSGGISSITISDGSGVIRNNRVLLAPGGGFGFNGSWNNNVLIEGNYVEDAISGLHGDTGGTTNLTMINNTFVNCDAVCDLANTPRYNLTFAFNNVIVSNTVYPSQALGFVFWPYNGSSYTNIFIFGNNVNYAGTSASFYNDFVLAYNVTGLTIANNAVDSHLTNYLSNCSNVSEYNNADIFGNYRYDLNIPDVGGNLAYGIASQNDYFFGGAGNNTMTATANTGVGYSALAADSTGSGNNAFGAWALQNNTTGLQNGAFGESALANNTSGSFNNAVGVWALSLNTAGNGNTADGFYCLYSNTVGSYNIGLGYAAGYQITNGSYNIDIGNYGLSSDNGIIRIGSANQTDTYLAGVIHMPTNVTVAGTNSALFFSGNGAGLTNLALPFLTTNAVYVLSTNQYAIITVPTNSAISLTLTKGTWSIESRLFEGSVSGYSGLFYSDITFTNSSYSSTVQDFINDWSAIGYGMNGSWKLNFGDPPSWRTGMASPNAFSSSDYGCMKYEGVVVATNTWVATIRFWPLTTGTNQLWAGSYLSATRIAP